MAVKRRYFSMEDRQIIAEMWKAGRRVPEIAAEIGSNEGTVYKELKRGWDGTLDENLRRRYDPVLAENRFRQILSERGRSNASGKRVDKNGRAEGAD